MGFSRQGYWSGVPFPSPRSWGSEEEFHSPNFGWFSVGFNCSYSFVRPGALWRQQPFLQSLTVLNPRPQGHQRVDTTLLLLLRTSSMLIIIPNILRNTYVCHARIYVFSIRSLIPSARWPSEVNICTVSSHKWVKPWKDCSATMYPRVHWGRLTTLSCCLLMTQARPGASKSRSAGCVLCRVVAQGTWGQSSSTFGLPTVALGGCICPQGSFPN